MRVHDANLFPFCPQPKNDGIPNISFAQYIGDLTMRPVGLTLIECEKWWRRVKKWNLTISLQVAASDGSFGPVDFPENGNYDVVRSGITTEADIPCTAYAFGPTTGSFFNFVLFAANLTSDPQLWTGVSQPFGFPSIISDGGMFYPAINFLAAYNPGWSGVNGTQVQSSFKDDTNTLQPHIVFGTMNLDGNAVPLAQSTNVGVYVAWTGEISLTPAEYWPYADSNNQNPIYDSATGAQLLNPITTDGY